MVSTVIPASRARSSMRRQSSPIRFPPGFAALDLTVTVLRVFTLMVTIHGVPSPSSSAQRAEGKGVRTQAQRSTEESAMTAMNWLATQLAWEQRLVELRTEER